MHVERKKKYLVIIMALCFVIAILFDKGTRSNYDCVVKYPQIETDSIVKMADRKIKRLKELYELTHNGMHETDSLRNLLNRSNQNGQDAAILVDRIRELEENRAAYEAQMMALDNVTELYDEDFDEEDKFEIETSISRIRRDTIIYNKIYRDTTIYDTIYYVDSVQVEEKYIRGKYYRGKIKSRKDVQS